MAAAQSLPIRFILRLMRRAARANRNGTHGLAGEFSRRISCSPDQNHR
jgi:hypothetical protein